MQLKCLLWILIYLVQYLNCHHKFLCSIVFHQVLHVTKIELSFGLLVHASV